MKSKAKKDTIEYKKQHKLFVKLKKRSKTGFFDNLETKITLNRFGQLLNHISAINMQKGDADILLIENNKFYLILVKYQMFSINLLFNNYFQSVTF